MCPHPCPRLASLCSHPVSCAVPSSSSNPQPKPCPPLPALPYPTLPYPVNSSVCSTPPSSLPPYPTLGGELISVLNSDENKTFGVVLRTPVDDSTGIPHILEHSVLCGSRK